jgi:hypothetical protein
MFQSEGFLLKYLGIIATILQYIFRDYIQCLVRAFEIIPLKVIENYLQLFDQLP